MALKKRVGDGWDTDFMLMFQNGHGYAFKSISNRDYVYVSRIGASLGPGITRGPGIADSYDES